MYVNNSYKPNTAQIKAIPPLSFLFNLPKNHTPSNPLR